MVQKGHSKDPHILTSVASDHIHLSWRHLGDFLVRSGDIVEAKSGNRAFIYKCLLMMIMMNDDDDHSGTNDLL